MSNKRGFYCNYQGYEVWALEPDVVVEVLDGLEVPLSDVRTVALQNQATDYYGEAIPETSYDHYVAGHSPLKAFLKKCAETKSYAMFYNA
jgi:hypothetical protein